MNNIKDQKFGKILVLERVGSDHRQSILWKCLCDCGVIMPAVVGSNLLSGNTTSCGCSRFAKGKDSLAWKGYGDIPGKYWNHVKNSAKKRGIKLNVDLQYCWELFLKQERKCALTGLPLILPVSSNDEQTASLDRIDSNNDYTTDNIQWVHKDINKIKDVFNQEYFIKLCNLVSKYKGDSIES